MSGPAGLPRGDQILSFAVKGIAGGIGLASEGIHAHRERKRHEKELKEQDKDLKAHEKDLKGYGDKREHGVLIREESNQSTRSLDSEGPVSPIDPEHIGTAEELWELDETQDEIFGAENGPPNEDPPAYVEEYGEDQAEEHVRGLQDHFLNAHRHDGPIKLEGGYLRLPVIIPQRRPKNRTRGFVRAYAPMLEEVGISCDMWMNFLDTFEKSSQASPWLNAINMAGFATCMLPTYISMAISVAITISVRIAMDMQSRQRINKFLLKINQEFFQPRGLYCLVMTWKPESEQICETVSLNKTINTATTAYHSGIINKFKQSQGTTFGDFGFPEAAPLVFPTLDLIGASDHEEAKKFKDKIKRKKNFVANYYDKRATAEFQGEHPDNLLSQNAGYKPKFTSRYADPNHPANSGNLLSLVTGGYINPPPGTLGGGLAPRGGYGLGMGRGFAGGGLGGLGYGGGGVGGFGGRGMGMGMGGMAGTGLGGRMAMSGRGLGGLGEMAYTGIGGRLAMAGGGLGGIGGRGMRMGMGPGMQGNYYQDPSGMGMGMGMGPGMPGNGYNPQDPNMSLQTVEQQQFMRNQQYQLQQQLYYQQQQQMGYYNQAGGYRMGFGGGLLGIGGQYSAPLLVKKILKRDVLYLMVVNMPSEEELAAAEVEAEKIRGYHQY